MRTKLKRVLMHFTNHLLNQVSSNLFLDLPSSHSPSPSYDKDEGCEGYQNDLPTGDDYGPRLLGH